MILDGYTCKILYNYYILLSTCKSLHGTEIEALSSFLAITRENFDNICPARPQKSMSNFVKVLTGGESPFASQVSDKGSFILSVGSHRFFRAFIQKVQK